MVSKRYGRINKNLYRILIRPEYFAKNGWIKFPAGVTKLEWVVGDFAPKNPKETR